MGEHSRVAGDVAVPPPPTADPTLVQSVEEAVAGADTTDLPGAQPERPVGADPHDFAGLYIRHRASFALQARKFLHDPRDVDEVLQESFLRLFLALPELETELQALAYCRRTITNLCIDRYRADQRRPRLVDLEDMHLDPTDETSYDDPVLRAEDAAIVRDALALLSPLHREALVKREIEEKPLPQIAAELGVPEENVKHLLYRARRALRRLLVGTSVEPGVDLTNTQMLRVANERLARGTLRAANVLIVLFVAAVTVVGAIRTGSQDRTEGSGDVLPTVVPGVTGPAGNAARPAGPLPTPHRHHAQPPAATPAAPPPAPVRTAPATAPQPVVPAPRHENTHQSKPSHPTPPAHHPAPQPPAATTTDLQPGMFAIHAPVLGAAGTAMVQTHTVELKPTGEWSNTSNFTAPAAAGDFTLQQVVEKSPAGVVSANVTPAVPTLQTGDATTEVAAAKTSSSSVSTVLTTDGQVLVSVDLAVAPQEHPAATVPTAPSLNIHVQALYTPDVTRVLAEKVTVVEGSASCCDSSASTTPRSPVSDDDTSPSLEPPAVGSAAVRPMSPTSRDDQQTVVSS